jgi:hypothetical protein
MIYMVSRQKASGIYEKEAEGRQRIADHAKPTVRDLSDEELMQILREGHQNLKKTCRSTRVTPKNYKMQRS